MRRGCAAQQSTSLRTLPWQQRYQAPSVWTREPEGRAGGLADRRARRRRQRAALEVGEQDVVLVDRPPGAVDQAAQVVHPLAVAGAQGEALAVDPRQPGRVRAAVGRVDVAAEVVGVRVARPHDGADHARAGRGGGRRARAREEGAPRRPGAGTPRPRGVEHRGELARVVHGPLGEHDAARAERDRERRAGHAPGGPCLRVVVLVEAAHGDAVPGERIRRRRELPAQAAARAREHGEPDALAREPVLEPARRAQRRTLAVDLERAARRRAAAAREHDGRGGGRGRGDERDPRSGTEQRHDRACDREQRRPPRGGAREPAAGAEAAARRSLVALREGDDLEQEEAGEHEPGGVRRAPGTPAAIPAASAASTAMSAAHAGAASRPGIPYAASATVAPVRSAAFRAAAASSTTAGTSHAIALMEAATYRSSREFRRGFPRTRAPSAPHRLKDGASPADHRGSGHGIRRDHHDAGNPVAGLAAAWPHAAAGDLGAPAPRHDA